MLIKLAMEINDNSMYRSTDDKFLAGVCSGLAHKVGANKWGIRFLFILGAIFYGMTIPVYIIFWFFFKPRPTFNP